VRAIVQPSSPYRNPSVSSSFIRSTLVLLCQTVRFQLLFYQSLSRDLCLSVAMVNFVSIIGGAIAVSSLAGFAVAHPGEHHDMNHVKRQIDARGLRAAAAKRSLSNCQNNLKHRELMQRSVQRRAQALNTLREKRGINGSKLFTLYHKHHYLTG
jgi:hypothetical protein